MEKITLIGGLQLSFLSIFSVKEVTEKSVTMAWQLG
jgi:hypothetical protein